MDRAEQIRRSIAWMSYVRKRRVLYLVGTGRYIGLHKEMLKHYRRQIGEIVKAYPDFPERFERKGLTGTENPPADPKLRGLKRD